MRDGRDRQDEDTDALDLDPLGVGGDPPVAAGVLPPEQLDALASSLLWRIGRAYDDGPVTVRVGFASAAPLFAALPRLRPASDLEVEAALRAGDLSVEWVGARGAGRA
jgi:hypothetical protein